MQNCQLKLIQRDRAPFGWTELANRVKRNKHVDLFLFGFLWQVALHTHTHIDSFYPISHVRVANECIRTGERTIFTFVCRNRIRTEGNWCRSLRERKQSNELLFVCHLCPCVYGSNGIVNEFQSPPIKKD